MIRVEVTDEHGTAAVIIDPPQLDLFQSAQVAGLAGQAITELAAVPGVNGTAHARKILLAALIRYHADQEAYERVAAQKGVLPL